MNPNRPFGSQALSLGELARAYGITTKVLRSWLRNSGLEKFIGRRHSRYLTPAELKEIINTFGDIETP